MTSAADLPPGSAISLITYTASPAAGADVLCRLPGTIGLSAVMTPHGGEDAPEGSLLALLVPTESDAGVRPDEGDELAAVRAWVDAPHDEPTAMMTTLQGVRIFWTRQRFAVLATPDRLRKVAGSIAEVTYYENELVAIEAALGEAWPQMEADVPLAFEFEAMLPEQRHALRARFQAVVLLSARMARIGPAVHCPHIHPPTLASQVNERMRERLQMPHRHELVGEQVEHFESVYEQCGQRASEFELAAKGHTLEKIIIALLLAQLVLWGFDILTTLGG